MATKEELLKIEDEHRDEFIESRKYEISNNLKYAAKNQKRVCKVRYHPLLEPYFNELCNNGLKIDSKNLQEIVFSW